MKEGAVVLDVGINRNDEGKLVGDVHYAAAAARASAITPVPGHRAHDHRDAPRQHPPGLCGAPGHRARRARARAATLGMAYDDGYGKPQVQLQFPPFQGWVKKLILINGGIFLALFFLGFFGQDTQRSVELFLALDPPAWWGGFPPLWQPF